MCDADGQMLGVLYKPWDQPVEGHEQLGPVAVRYSDLYVKAALRRSNDAELISYFDFPALPAIFPGYTFFVDYATTRRIGFCIGDGIDEEILWGAADARLLLFRPSTKE
jgi:hypothetical protein